MPISRKWSGILLGLMRVMIALAFMQHGTSKLFGFPTTLGSPDALTLPLGLLETVGGGMLAVGLFTRPVAFLLAGEMAVAYWWGHWWSDPNHSFYPLVNHGTEAMIYCFVFLYLAAAGGGNLSLDRMLGLDRHHGSAL
jgi:putative oxidoreductase